MIWDVLASIFLLAGGVLLLIAAWGVVVLPNALARQHAATEAGTLAQALICIGALLFALDWAWSWRLLLILGFLLVTLPVASHLLVRAAVRESNLVPDASRVRLIGDDPAQAADKPPDH